jgi:hypothetical protein
MKVNILIVQAFSTPYLYQLRHRSHRAIDTSLSRSAPSALVLSFVDREGVS